MSHRASEELINIYKPILLKKEWFTESFRENRIIIEIEVTESRSFISLLSFLKEKLMISNIDKSLQKIFKNISLNFKRIDSIEYFEEIDNIIRRGNKKIYTVIFINILQKIYNKIKQHNKKRYSVIFINILQKDDIKNKVKIKIKYIKQRNNILYYYLKILIPKKYLEYNKEAKISIIEKYILNIVFLFSIFMPNQIIDTHIYNILGLPNEKIILLFLITSLLYLFSTILFSLLNYMHARINISYLQDYLFYIGIFKNLFFILSLFITIYILFKSIFSYIKRKEKIKMEIKKLFNILYTFENIKPYSIITLSVQYEQQDLKIKAQERVEYYLSLFESLYRGYLRGPALIISLLSLLLSTAIKMFE